MQYLLTQSEYDGLTPVKRLQSRNDALEVARKIIVKLTGHECGKSYCDSCPISDIGGHFDNTQRPTREQSKHICIEYRRYSK